MPKKLAVDLTMMASPGATLSVVQDADELIRALLALPRDDRIRARRALTASLDRDADHESAAAPVAIAEHVGARTELMSLFALADDSPAAIATYMHDGVVFVARDRERAVGHVQLLMTREPGIAEIASIAVEPSGQGRGLGAALVAAALLRARADGAQCVRLATATADIGNLRFYQRLGFRMARIERDAFTQAAGYPARTIEGIPLRDRVWFEHQLSG